MGSTFCSHGPEQGLQASFSTRVAQLRHLPLGMVPMSPPVPNEAHVCHSTKAGACAGGDAPACRCAMRHSMAHMRLRMPTMAHLRHVATLAQLHQGSLHGAHAPCWCPWICCAIGLLLRGYPGVHTPHPPPGEGSTSVPSMHAGRLQRLQRRSPFIGACGRPLDGGSIEAHLRQGGADAPVLGQKVCKNWPRTEGVENTTFQFAPSKIGWRRRYTFP
jgi:hypothetical protein